jgi:hypothetical protein
MHVCTCISVESLHVIYMNLQVLNLNDFIGTQVHDSLFMFTAETNELLDYSIGDWIIEVQWNRTDNSYIRPPSANHIGLK